MMSISPLPEGVRSSVRSGIILFDLTRVVEELVFNSLDAGATKVSVHVGVGAGFVKVVDDGSGITRDGLVLLGERYATSKFHQLADVDSDGGSFGFRGEALASISDVSLLEIVTKAYGRPNGYRKVIKGCKCLYLGIDDDRKDVGTTVNVRDLFYNQPVRRKYMQSSPKKVLHSVKKCILRITLVHSQISFKIVDVESGDELLCTQPSSPLFILKSGFGLEVPHSLHELNISDGVLKLSGYISDPVVSFITKAFQYVYINSRFVCKGPIHKLLNQLASTFECLDLWKVSDGSQNRKRSRSKACPSYVLNLSCHRTLYDLAFEPSKTYVEFKDWDTVLAFTKKAIQQLWKENPTFEDVIRKDQIWKEAEDVLTADEDFLDADFSETSAISKKKHKTENRKALLEIFSSPLSSENNLLSLEDPFLDNRSNDNFDNCLSSAWGVKSLEDDPGASNELAEIALSCDLVSGCIEKPLLQGCSSKSNLPLERALLVNDEEFEFQIDSFRTNQKQAGPDDRVDIFEVDGTNQSFDILSRTYRSDKASTSQAFTREITHCSLFTDSDFPSRAFVKSIPSYADHFIGEDFIESNTKTGIGNFCSSHQTSNSDWCFLSSAPLFQETPWDVKHCKSENACWWSSHSAESTSRQFMECGERGHKSRYGIMSKGSSQENCSSGGRYNTLHVNDCFGSSGDTCKFLQGYNGQYELSPEYADLLPDEIGSLHLESCFKNYTGIDQYKRQRDLVRHQRYEPGHVSKERSRRSHSAPPFYKGKRRFFSLNHPSIVNAENPEVNAIHNALTYSEVSGLKNARQLSNNCQLYHKPSTMEHLSTDSRLDMDKITGVSENSKEIGKGEKFEQSPNFDFQDTAPDRVFISGESQDSLDSWSKWQNCSSHITDRNKSSDVYDKSNILNILSGFFHLAGDFLVPESINKSCLVDAKVLQQVDKKFIPVVGGGILAIIDQHAADERIRLEELRKKVLSGEAKTIHYLDGEQELMLPEIAYQLLQNYTEEIKGWGWICNIHHQDSRLFKRNLDLLHKRQAVIKLVAVPNILGVNLSDVDLLEFLQQLADTDGSSTMPPSVLRVLNMKACRGAIMFGDSLLPSECSLIVEELKQTSLCFQCAHGRPTTIPLVNLDALHKQIANLGLSDGESNKSWHGLRLHEVNIERAAQRLNSARG